jgi:cytidine deaminase
MGVHPITREDEKLIEEITTLIKKHYRYGKHHIGAAIRTKSGKIVTAVNLEAYIGRAAICAEAIAIGKAISEGENTFDTIVAVRHPHSYEKNQEIRVVSPCGICRELIRSYGIRIKVIILNNGRLEKHDILDLLPFRYSRQ